VTAFLIDEMFPVVAAALLRDSYGHDAVHVAEAGLRAAEDADVAGAAGSLSPRTSRTSPPSAMWCSCSS